MNDGFKRRTHARIRVAAVTLALSIGVAASAQAGSGGLAGPGEADSQPTSTQGSDRCASSPFGKRKLRLGDCGQDVKTLNWILKARSEGRRIQARPTFAVPTDSAVRRVQRSTGIRRSGVVNKKTRKALVKRMDRSLATWYGPGFWGNRTACGQKLKRSTIGVAHKTLPCGTRVTIARRGRFVRAKVIDRGPYAHGATWDLTQATAKRIGMTATSNVRAAVIR